MPTENFQTILPLRSSLVLTSDVHRLFISVPDLFIVAFFASSAILNVNESSFITHTYTHMDRYKISKWEVVLGAPDIVNIPCLMYDTHLCQLDVKLTIN